MDKGMNSPAFTASDSSTNATFIAGVSLCTARTKVDRRILSAASAVE